MCSHPVCSPPLLLQLPPGLAFSGLSLPAPTSAVAAAAFQPATTATTGLLPGLQGALSLPSTLPPLAPLNLGGETYSKKEARLQVGAAFTAALAATLMPPLLPCC